MLFTEYSLCIEVACACGCVCVLCCPGAGELRGCLFLCVSDNDHLCCPLSFVIMGGGTQKFRKGSAF